MIKAVLFDFFGVLEQAGQPNKVLFAYIQTKLKSKYKIGVISNSSGGWRDSLLSPEQLDLFDDIVLSGEQNIAKPHPDIYQLAAQNLKVQPSECIFIDDSEIHCEGARTAGLQAIHYENFEQFENDLESVLKA